MPFLSVLFYNKVIIQKGFLDMHFLKKFARFVFRVIRFILNVILCVLGAAGWLLQALLQTVTVLFVLSLAAGDRKTSCRERVSLEV